MDELGNGWRIRLMAAAALLHCACGPLVGGGPVAAPAFVAVEPPPPSPNRRPLLTGSAERGAIVTVYASSDCASEPVGQGWASAVTGRFSLPASAALNARTTFYANATDAVRKVSLCSAGPIYVHDDRPPAAPALMGFSPATPSPEPMPQLSGAAEPESRLSVFARPGCSGQAVAVITVPATGEFGVLVPVATGVTTTYSAQAFDAAGNVSPCSPGRSYLHDATAPDAPVLAGLTPWAGSSAVAPVLQGTAEPGALVTFHADAACAGPPVGSTRAGADGVFAGQASIDTNRSSSFWARATDAAGNPSACSPSAATFLVTSVAMDFDVPGCLASGSRPAGVALDLSRSSAAEFLAGSWEVRCESDQLRIGPTGLIVEEGRANAVAPSARLEDAAWTLDGAACVVWPEALRAPNGTPTMDVLDGTGGAGGGARCQVASTAAAGEFAASAWAAAVAGTTGATVRAHCATGVAATACRCERSDAGPCTATLLPDGCAASAVVGVAPVRLVAGVSCAAPTTAPSMCLEPGAPATGAGQTGFWGAQLEAGARFATGYVPTEATSATRLPEAVSMAGPASELLASGWAVLSPDGELADLGTVFASGAPGLGVDLRFAAGTPRLTWVAQPVDHDAHAAPGRRSATTVGWAVEAGRACLYWDGIERCTAVTGTPTAGDRAFLGSADGGAPPFLNGAVGALHLGERPGVALNTAALMVLGDSLSAPVTTFCARPWPTAAVDLLGVPWLVTNVSVNAAVTSHLVVRWRTYAANGHGVVAVLGGTNDIVLAETADQIFDRLRSIYDEARAAGKRVVPITVPPSSKFSPAFLDKWRALNGLIRRYCVEQGIRCADADQAMNSGADALAPLYDSGDHKHFNQAGCDLVASMVAEIIR
jgi:GDSL-like lipase/acylhydrolase family protein